MFYLFGGLGFLWGAWWFACYMKDSSTDRREMPEEKEKREAEERAAAGDEEAKIADLALDGEEPDEEMLAKCQDIAREEFANQATLEDENSY